MPAFLTSCHHTISYSFYFRGLLQGRTVTRAVSATARISAEEDNPGCVRWLGQGQGAGGGLLLQPLHPLRAKAPEPDGEGAQPLQNL